MHSIRAMMNISAQRIRRARAQLKESQTAFAKRLGVDQGTISRWEQGGVTDHLRAMAVKSILDQVEEEEFAA
jgi:DNA-binding transcriptional regulator YiaG